MNKSFQKNVKLGILFLSVLSTGLVNAQEGGDVKGQMIEKVSIKKMKDAAKVLYVTHEPGKYHDYTGQRKTFEKIALTQEWNVDVMSSSYDGLLTSLAADTTFAKGYDVVIYNVCVADTKNLEAAYNIMAQTREYGVDSLLIHGALHSFWKSFSPSRGVKKKGIELKSVGIAKGKIDPAVEVDWCEICEGKEFPVWGDFCGIASDRHSKKAPIKITKIEEHAATNEVPKSYTTGISELYLPLYKTEGIKELLMGEINKKNIAPVLWELSYGEAKVMCFTLGHFTEEWAQPNFQAVLTGSVNYLIKN